MDTSGFQQARLIPIIGIRGEQEQEGRTTSAFLAVLVAVPEFARSLLKELGAPAGRPQTFIEPEFLIEERTVRPDGMIVLERAGRTWSALVEVKTGRNNLKLDQVNDYLDVCRTFGIDALITISNQVLGQSGEHPLTGLDGRKLKKIRLAHFSWIHVLSQALMQKDHRGVSDPDQAWILNEFVRYLQHPASGTTEFDDMGQGWTEVLRGLPTGTLAQNDPRVLETLEAFESLMQFMAMRLSVKLGVGVKALAPKSPGGDLKKLQRDRAAAFVKSGALVGALRIPNTASDLAVVADLRTGYVTVSVEVSAPLEGRSLTRVNWLLRQIKEGPASLKVESRLRRTGSAFATGILLGDALDKPARLVPEGNNEIFGFRLTMMRKLGTKRGAGQGSFVQSVIEAVELGYHHMLESFKPWSARAPKLATPEVGPSDSPFDPEGPDLETAEPLMAPEPSSNNSDEDSSSDPGSAVDVTSEGSNDYLP